MPRLLPWYLQKEKEGESMELQAGKHHLGPRKGDGANPPESSFKTQEG